MKTNTRTMSVIFVTIDLFLIVYFTMALNLLVILPDIQTQMDMIVKVFRPFVAVFIPLYNMVVTFFCLLLLGIIFVLAIAKHFDLLDVKTTVKLSELKPEKRGVIKNVLSLIDLALIWLAWSYGAYYMASLKFSLMLIGRLYLWVLNRLIEHVRDKAVKMVSEGKV
ncbi:MAG: hypothetical protein LBP76_02700 [Treponema sp.]|jgi:hypothetical protein|nr:hypothetical protein [Treponema sp.]